MSLPDPEALAATRTLAAWDRGEAIDRNLLPSPADTELAQTRQLRINALRVARGERPVGYKIGFTNRTIWPIYNVHHPIWAPVWNTTLTQLDSPTTECSLKKFVQPRLEPEIVFGLRTSPISAAPQAVFEAIDWIAHGFEIVQSPYPDWKFNAAEAIAAQSLHGALLVGPKKRRAEIADAWQAMASISLTLSLDGKQVAQGEASMVLDNPVCALGHLVEQLALIDRQLQAGDVITTGTLTDAQVLSPDQTWRSTIHGAALDGLQLRTR